MPQKSDLLSQNKPSILLIGGGGHCKSCIDVIEQKGRFAIAGIVDKPASVGGRILDYPVIGETYFFTSVPPSVMSIVKCC